ncbi:MAG: OmpH family outer membrane protein [Holosporaceae bacterium]|nr:OmpH family outer membrane protein [Holosporaceae bacterium]
MKNVFLMFALCAFQAECFASSAILDLKRIATESEAGKDIEKQIEKLNQDASKDLEELESQIKLLDSKKKKSAEDSRKIEELQVLLYDMVRTKKYQITEAYKKAVAIVDREMKKIIEKICKKDRYKVVINSDAIVYATQECKDITGDVISELNRHCKEVKVEITEQK